MSDQGRFTWEEYIVATFGGIGITAAIAGAMFSAFGTLDNHWANISVFAGIGAIIISMTIWLVLLKPWTKFDDLQTPYYTGHHHDEHHEEVHSEEHEALAHVPQVEAIVAPEPVAEQIIIEEDAAPVAALVEQVVIEEVAPVIETASASEPVVFDDLKIIDGIGPKVEEALHKAGITTYAQITQISPEELERIVKVEHQVRIVGGTETWPKQAEFLANNDQSGFEAYLAEIKADQS